MHHRIMRAGNSQMRTAAIMYLWTATIAFPVTGAAFAPLWIAGVVALALAATSYLVSSKGKVKA
jgi:UDP-GlcNAc:undecaprenyl-phosphate GlcNAc-1-phosphate transferase